MDDTGVLVEMCEHSDIGVARDGCAAGEIERRSKAYRARRQQDSGPSGSADLSSALASAGLPNRMDLDAGIIDADALERATPCTY